MSKLYKSMNCPICRCSTVNRDHDIYECVACKEQWSMITPENKICHYCGMEIGPNPSGSCPIYCVKDGRLTLI